MLSRGSEASSYTSRVRAGVARTWRLAAGLTALSAVVGSVALAGQAYTDPTGDSQTAADITGVELVNDDGGVLHFTITWAGGQLLPLDDVVWLVIDTDQNGTTGGKDGEEVIAEFDGDPANASFGSSYYGRWDGTNINYDLDAPTATAQFQPGRIDLSINKSDLNNSTKFDFWLFSDQYSADTVVAEDAAPDGTGVYTYELTAKQPVTLSVGRPLGTPFVPVAGKRFVVGVHVARSDAEPVTGVTVRCTARAGTKVLRAVGSLAGGFARCSMTVPKSSKGKLLRGSVAVTIAEASVTKAFTFKVR
jgi:hypothetical protein